MAMIQATLLALVTRLANDLDDLVELTATSNGTTTTFVDAVNVNSMRESYDGREFWGTSAPNAGKIATVTATSDSTITFTPALTSTQADNTAILVNKLGRGFRIQDYIRAINNAIQDFNGVARTDLIATIGSVFDAAIGTIAVPENMTECHRVEYQDSEGIWREIRRATPRGGYGWTAEAANALIRVEGDPAWQADGYTVRLHGSGFQEPLVDQDDICTFLPGGIAARAAYYLCRSAFNRDSRYAQMTVIYREDSEAMMQRARTTRRSGSVLVRS